MSNLISFYTIMGLLLNIVSISWFLQAWEISKSSVTFWDAISVKGILMLFGYYAFYIDTILRMYLLV